jgi:hypothetical protein
MECRRRRPIRLLSDPSTVGTSDPGVWTFVSVAERPRDASWTPEFEGRYLVTQVKTHHSSRVDATNPPEALGRRLLAVALFGLGAGAASVALLGPLFGDVIRYHASEGAVNQIVGGDVAGLFLVGPWSILAGVLVWRGHRAGPVLALGPALYALYMYSQLALGGDFIRYPGNSERFFLLYLGLFVLAGVVAVRAWTLIDVEKLPGTIRWADRTIGIFFLFMAVFLVGGLHLPGLIDAWADQPASPEYLADPAVFWLVKFMDLGIVVPGLVVAGIGLLRPSLWVAKIKYAAVGWAALLGSSVAGMAIVMQLTGDPAATFANTIAFSVFAAISLGMAWLVYSPLLRSDAR